MSTPVMWMNTNSGIEIVAPGEFTDDDKSTNEQIGVLLGDHFTVVVEGELSQLREFFREALHLLDQYEDTH